MEIGKAYNFCPFVINSNICTELSDIATFDSFMDATAGNVGNSYITWSLLKELGCNIASLGNHHIKNIYSYDFNNTDRDVDIINTECTHVILVLQDQIKIHESYGYRLPFRQIENFLKRIRKPILIAGLGANSLEGFVPNFYKLLDDELISFLQFISGICETIGIRGYFTQEVLHDLGIDNVTVIGCPSYYECGRNRIIKKPVWSENIKLASSWQYWDGVDCLVYLQDKLPHVASIIKKIAFSKEITLSREEYEAWINKRYKIFSSIDSWKKDIGQNDFYIGWRVHGSMVAMNSGVPTCVLNPDSRAREMCEYLNVPYHPELRKAASPKIIYDVCSYDKLNSEYNGKLDQFVKFLIRNGFEYKPLENQSGGIELPLYRAKVHKVNLMSSIRYLYESFFSSTKQNKYRARYLLKDYISNLL